MLRDVVGSFLSSLTEREFDAPLLAMLGRRGFTDIHFIHGSFEFGKDVIAKYTCPETRQVSQYVIQSKSGDIGLSGWREVRPQLEESGYNTRAHPNYDGSLRRVAVLVTTGRLKGAAAIDAQEFKQSVEARGQSTIEFWDYLTLTEWLTENPETGLAGRPNNMFMEVVSGAVNGKLREADLEKYTRCWLDPRDDTSKHLALACIEAAIIANRLRISSRLDLAAGVSLHLLRATETSKGTGADQTFSSSALRLFTSYASQLLLQVEPVLDDRYALAQIMAGPASIVTYPVFAMRLFEIFGLLAIVAENEDEELAARAQDAVVSLASKHPGSARPVSDNFAVSMLAPALVLHRSDTSACEVYLRTVAQWILDRSDPELAGLGLGASGESEEAVIERLLGGAFDFTRISLRRQSLVATTVLDLTYLLGFRILHNAIRDNLEALDIHPIELAVSPERAKWRRAGEGVGAPRKVHLDERYSSLSSRRGVGDPHALRELLLMSVSRSWYMLDALAAASHRAPLRQRGQQ